MPGRPGVLAAQALGRADHVHQQAVVATVVAALELDDPAAPGDPPGETQGVHRRLAAAVAEQHRLGAGDVLHQLLGDQHLEVGRADADAVDAVDGLLHPGVDRRVVVPQDLRPEGQVIVQVLPPVGVPQAGAGGPHPGDRRVQPAGERGHPAGDHRRRPGRPGRPRPLRRRRHRPSTSPGARPNMKRRSASGW